MALDSLRRRLARLIAPSQRGPLMTSGARMYNSAQSSRTMIGFGSGVTSGDSETAASLAVLRNRSRALMRDSAYAKRARQIVVDNVVGAGIQVQAQVMTTRDVLADRVNEGIEHEWDQWCEALSCHTGGVLHFYDLERLAAAQVFEAGEVFIRKHVARGGASEVPLCLELIEPERLADNVSSPLPGSTNQVRMGIEVDNYLRPVAYYVRKNHPGDLRWGTLQKDEVMRVPADQMIHLGIRDRFPQTRCVPWMHAVIRKLADIDGYSEAEITAARAAACYMGFIETEDPNDGQPGTGNVDQNGTHTFPFEPGLWERLAFGQKATFVAPNRPNAAIEAFLRHMLREMAAGVNVSYESLSRDYSQSNYSSSRLALLDDRALWRILQQWWVRSFRAPLHREWMRLAVMARAIDEVPIGAYATDPSRYNAVKFRLRGWPWVDPQKEVEAHEKAVQSGFMAIDDVLSQYGDGRDVEDVVKARKRELQMFDEAGVKVSTTVEEKEAPAAKAPPPKEPAADDDRGSVPSLRIIGGAE